VSLIFFLGKAAELFGPGNKGGPAKNIYTKSERLTLSRMVTLAERVNLYSGQRVILPKKIKTCEIESGPGNPSEPPGLDKFYLLPRPLVGTLRRSPFYFLNSYILHSSPPSFLRSSFCSLSFILHPFNLRFLLTFSLFLFAYSSFHLSPQFSSSTYFFFLILYFCL
jgi:hypothetical protein